MKNKCYKMCILSLTKCHDVFLFIATMPKLTPDMVARYKAALMRKVQQHNGGRQSMIPQKRRYGVIEDDDDEYDSELDDFIVDGEDEQGNLIMMIPRVYCDENHMTFRV